MFTNIAAYHFCRLDQLKVLRTRLLQRCREAGLRGTILLSTEGINLFVAGSEESIERLLAELRAIPGLAELTPKYSYSPTQPFRRMLVKIKKEIIAFGVEGIDPGMHTSPRLSPQELKKWLDEGRPVTLLDTRNDYEIKLGTFRNAISLGIDHFRDFPHATAKLAPELKKSPVVVFCTGGIRCEKAGPYLEQQGFEDIHQLDGGILKYFEECGSAHYDGDCFVFDQRVGVDPGLHETADTQCFACLAPLTESEQADPRYVPGKSCPYCHRTEEQRRSELLKERHEALCRAVTPLPGSEPYEQQRPIHVPADYDGSEILKLLTGLFPHVAREEWESMFEAGHLKDRLGNSVGAGHVVRAGERYLRCQPATREPDVNVNVRILWEDSAIVVIDKPAPLPMHPCGRYNLNSLQSILAKVYAPECPRPVHRLDANTWGVVVFARTRHFAKRLQPQFADGSVQKRYLARVHGHPPTDSFSCTLPIGQETTDLGARDIDLENGLESVTDFQVRVRYDDGTSLLEVVPRTGRTNQIRVHLWQLGWPIVGDPTYLAEGKRGTVQTMAVEDPPMCLLAESITFAHPIDGVTRTFTADAPPWLR